MTGFGNFVRTASEIEAEIIHCGIALSLDWDDEAAVRVLARSVLEDPAAIVRAAHARPDGPAYARLKLCALAQLMLVTMARGARAGVGVHGGKVWKTFGRALYEIWQEQGMQAAR